MSRCYEFWEVCDPHSVTLREAPHAHTTHTHTRARARGGTRGGDAVVQTRVGLKSLRLRDVLEVITAPVVHQRLLEQDPAVLRQHEQPLHLVGDTETPEVSHGKHRK